MKYLLLALVLCSFNAKSQTINTAPLDAYWQMIEPLKHGDSLSHETWNNFLAIEANRYYINNQDFKEDYLEILRKNIQFVYMPKYDSLLQARLKAMEVKQFSYWQTYKVYMYRKHEAALKAYEQELKEPAYLEKMYANVWPWLPKNLQKRDSSVIISLLGFDNDAIAGNGIIISTLWSAYSYDKLQKAIVFAHEMHHVLRGGNGFNNMTENEKGLLYYLVSTLNEGTADMVDKRLAIARESELPTEFQNSDFELFQADSILKQVDTTILNMVKSNGAIYKTEKDYRNLIRWTSGHCPGYYMADVIVRNGYRKQMLKHIRNPFYFVYLYNKAANGDSIKPPVFSSASITYIKKMEKKYWTGT